jgi:DNA polymerase-3 subunit delta
MTETDFYKQTQAAALSGAYLLHGEEELTKRDAIKRVLALLDAGMREMNLASLQAPAARELLEACANLPLFDRFRVVIANEPDEDAVAGAIAPNTVPSETILLLVRRGKARDSKGTKELAAQNRAIEFMPLSEERAVKLIAKIAEEETAVFPPQLARELINRVGTGGHALQNETQKLCAYAGRGKEITREMIEKCVVFSEEANIFNLLNFFLRGKQREGYDLLKKLQQEGQSAMSLAYFLENRLRQLCQAREFLDAGKTAGQAASLLGGNPYAAQKSVEAARLCDMKTLLTAISRIAEVDFFQKQGKKRDSDALLWALLASF